MTTEQVIIEGAITVFNNDLSAPLERVAAASGITRRTLHRYFKDRAALLEACINDMMQTWQSAMLSAYDKSEDPIIQLENMLYAGIDCGVKYAFLNKLGTAHTINPETSERYKRIREKWFAMVPLLQQQKIISEEMSASWIRILFTNLISASIQALDSDDIARNDVKKLAWYSLRRGIGIQ